jgi:hypothetical protein
MNDSAEVLIGVMCYLLCSDHIGLFKMSYVLTGLHLLSILEYDGF